MIPVVVEVHVTWQTLQSEYAHAFDEDAKEYAIGWVDLATGLCKVDEYAYTSREQVEPLVQHLRGIRHVEARREDSVTEESGSPSD